MLILTDKRNYDRIGDAIREVGRTEERFLPSEMSDAIRNMPKVAMPVDVISNFKFDFVFASSAADTMAIGANASYTFPMDITMATRAERG